MGRGGGRVPRGSSSQDRAQLCGIPTPMSPSRHSVRTRTHTRTRPPDSQATDSQTDPLPNQERSAPSRCLFITPQSLLGGAGPPRPPPAHPPGLPGPAYSHSTEQAPPAQAAKVAAKKLEVNLRLDSAVGEGSSTTPGMHPKTSCWGRRPSWAALHPSSHRFVFLFFVFWGTEVSVGGGTDIRTENEPEKGGRNL